MGAYAALFSLQHVLDQIVPDPDHDQDSSILGYLRQEIKSLRENIGVMVKFFDEFPKVAGGELEGRMRDLVQQAEDLIEGHISDEKRGADHIYWRVMYFIVQLVLYFKLDGHEFDESARLKFFNRLRMHQQLERVMKDMETIVEEVKGIMMSSSETEDLVLPHPGASSSPRLDSSSKGTVVAVRLEVDLQKIREKLYGDQENLDFIPIIGMGGIGKTTLAQFAYEDPLSIDHFDVRGWVTISQDSDIQKIFSGILFSVDRSTKEPYDTMDEGKLLENLHKFLKGRRYLIVIDDVSNTTVWDALRRAFPNDLNKSRIIITSRGRDVATYINSSEQSHHIMNLMDKDQSWNLLREKVFGQDCPPELQRIGELIADKCGGLPLAISVIAGILINDNPAMPKTWESVAKSIDEGVNIDLAGDFTELLSLSYKHLPHHLRPCFLYMGAFPKDDEIRVSKLIKLWAAEGFLNSTDVQQAAEKYLEDLIDRSLVRVAKRKPNGKIETVKIHNLLRDLSIKIAKNEKFLQVVNKDSAVGNSRRLSTCSYVMGKFGDINGSSIRTILSPFPCKNSISWSSFPLLRILDADVSHSQYFPIEIGNLFQLRYLALTTSKVENYVKALDSLSKLQNLQTLIIMTRPGVDGEVYIVPFGTWRLSQLRHLILFNAYLPDPCPGALTTFENLHTLSRVDSFICSEWILKLIPNLTKLKIFYKSDVLAERGWSEYSLTNLQQFSILEKLNLKVDTQSGKMEYRLHKSDISFPTSLKKSTLCGCQIPWQDMEVVGLLPNLQVLQLRDNACHGNTWETNEDEFCSLRVLEIVNSDPLEWETENLHFPCLERLRLVSCRKLEELPADIGEICTLKLIELEDCRPDIQESAKSIEKEQHENGNNELQVRILQTPPSRQNEYRRCEEALKRRSIFRHNQRWLE